MSLDETYVQMQNFEKALRDFNMNLRASLAELEAQHDKVSPIWNDQMRKKYDAIWGPFLQTMKHYNVSEGPGYIEFLNIKLHTLRRYLYGD
jgi:uncharacterized protein YukE